jgi:hypothetical protein
MGIGVFGSLVASSNIEAGMHGAFILAGIALLIGCLASLSIR